MRTDVIRVYKAVHTWTGIVAGMALFIAFYAGALTLFKEPIARWSAPPDAAVAGVPLADAPALIARTLAAQPQVARDFTLHLQPGPAPTAHLGWQRRAPGADDHDTFSATPYTATLQADGMPRIAAAAPSKVEEFIDILHRVVGLPVDNDGTRWVMGAIAALYAVALVSGVIVLLPTLVKDFFALRVGKNLKRMWLDAHNVVGIVSLPFHALMAVTAAGFAFHDGIYALQDRLLHGGTLASSWAPARAAPTPGAGPTARDTATMLPPADLMARAQALSPGFTPTLLQYTQVTGPRAAVRVWGRDDTAIMPRSNGGFVAMDPYSGRIVAADYLPGHQSAAYTTVTSLFALHFATFGGTPVQWMYFLLGLAGAWLFYGGNLLWVESRRKAQRKGAALPVQRRDTAWMAAGTVGVCLGCVSGISLTIAAGKWLNGHVADLTVWHQGLYYAVFFASIGWAFLRGGARASVELLALAAACTFAIPATTVLAWAFPAWGLWAHGGTALGVDATAFAGGLALVWMARATARRVYHGPVDSVWSAHAPAVPAPAASQVPAA